jgi:hypothetical protein
LLIVKDKRIITSPPFKNLQELLRASRKRITSPRENGTEVELLKEIIGKGREN